MSRENIMLTVRRVLFLVLLACAGNASADTYVFPHLLEQNNSQNQQAGTSESVLHFTLPVAESCAPVNTTADIQVWWYNADGTPAQSATSTDLCAPCSFTMGASAPSLEVDLNDIVGSKGGYPTAGNGFDTYVVTEVQLFMPEVDDEVIVSLETKSWSDAMTLPSTSLMKVRPLQDRVVVNATCRSFIFDHLVETAGTVATGSNYDSQIFAVYTDPSPTAPDVNLDVYLFDATTGAQLQDPVGGAICNPCSFPLGTGVSAASPKLTLRLDDLLTSGGTSPFPGSQLHVLAVVNATGGDPNQVSMSSSVTTARSGPSDLSVDLAAADEIAAATATAAEEILQRRLRLGNRPNPFNPRTTLSYTLAREDRVEIRIVDSRGRVVRSFRDEHAAAGDHELVWDGRDDAGRELPSGVYIAHLKTSDQSSSHKMALLR
jgi:hypothetical protein